MRIHGRLQRSGSGRRGDRGRDRRRGRGRVDAHVAAAASTATRRQRHRQRRCQDRPSHRLTFHRFLPMNVGLPPSGQASSTAQRQSSPTLYTEPTPTQSAGKRRRFQRPSSPFRTLLTHQRDCHVQHRHRRRQAHCHRLLPRPVQRRSDPDPRRGRHRRRAGTVGRSCQRRLRSPDGLRAAGQPRPGPCPPGSDRRRHPAVGRRDHPQQGLWFGHEGHHARP
ncbi:hypothetical protein D3C73_1152640 [compost metagenome]